MEEERASFLLRTLSGPRGGAAAASGQGARGSSHIAQILSKVLDNKVYTTSRRSLSFVWQWGGAISWVLGTSLMVLIFPLWLEIGRELDLGQLEQDIMLGYQARGYPPQQLQMMQQQGQFGIPPMPPPAQPQFE